MQKAIYTTVGIDELLSHVQALKGAGARFVQMHAERCVDDGSYRLVYTFINVRAAQEQIARDGNYAIENLVVEGIDQYQEIPSISSYYPAVFPFENEVHDLFGLAITDMQVDFKGFFYQVSTAEPMSVITPEVKAAREKAMKVRAAAEAKARKAAAEKAAAATAAAGEGAEGAGDAAGAAAKPAAAAGSDAQHDEAAAKAALKAAEMEAKLAAMDPEKAAKVRAALAAKAARDKQKKEA
ncbi:MAG: NADH-quinone oxidoreductase subunit C [Collinsella sp.]|nr:NADH-quinone oxidoreductase subunit C [Collinsella sp.]